MQSAKAMGVLLLIVSTCGSLAIGAESKFTVDVRSVTYSDGAGTYVFDGSNGFEILSGSFFARLDGGLGSLTADGSYRLSAPLATQAFPDPPGASAGITTNGLFGSFPGPSEWSFSAVLGDVTANDVGVQYEARVGMTNSGLGARIRARWFTGEDEVGTYYNNALILHTRLAGRGGYTWDSAAQDGGPGDIFLTDVDPQDTEIELMVAATNGGQTVGTYYRLDGDVQWHLAHSHTLPAGFGPVSGFSSTFPSIVITNDALAVPEPGYLALLTLGLGVIALKVRRIQCKR